MKKIIFSLSFYFVHSIVYASTLIEPSTCTNFSGIYLSDDMGSWERCIEIQQKNCKEYKYTWHMSDTESYELAFITDGVYRLYASQTGTMKAFRHVSNGNLISNFFDIDDRSDVSETIYTKMDNGNIVTRFFPHMHDRNDAIVSTLNKLSSVKECFQ